MSRKCLTMAKSSTNSNRILIVITAIFMLSSAHHYIQVVETVRDSEFLPFGDTDDLAKDFAEIDSDGFTIDEKLADTIEDEQRSRFEMFRQDAFEKEQAADHKPLHRHQFDKTCPYGFFACSDGECLSPRWRCDGHYDCDDFSDEINCTNIDVDQAASSKATDQPKIKLPQPTLPPHTETSEIKFESALEPMMLFSTGLSIRGFWMRSRIYFDVVSMASRSSKPDAPPTITQALSVFFDMLSIDRSSASSGSLTLKSKSTIVGVDMDPSSKEVFWVELGKDAGVFSTVIDNEEFELRARRQFFGPKRKTIVDSGLLSPEDIALDIIGKNIYITDAGLPAIVACSIKHSHCKMIVKDDTLHKPRAIIADSSTGWLIYTDWGDHPGIYLVSMDGRRRETLINTDVVWPNGLAADYSTNQLYWADARLSKIERVDLITKKRREVIKESAANPFSLSLFENRIYWSDWSGSDIRTCDKMTGNGTKVIMRADNIYGIHIYHPNIYGKTIDQPNPCWSKRCSHLCLLAPSSAAFADRKPGSLTASCACPESMALSIGDRATCYEVQLSFLIINVKNYIAQVFPERIGLHTVEKVIYSKEHTIHDVASDWIHYRLFFFDAAKQHIYSVDLNKGIRIDEFMPVHGQTIKALLYDSSSDNLYWLDPSKGTMTMCPVKGKYETVMRNDLDQPTSMVLDARNRVFYVSMLGSMPHIMRMDIFANKESDLVIIANDIGQPVALHLDDQQQRLYWADANRESIESLDLDVKSQTSGIKPNSRVYHRRRLGTVLAFSVYHDSFLWTIKNSDYLFKAKIGEHVEASSKIDEPRKIAYKIPPNPTANGRDPAGLNDSKRIILVDPHHEIVNSPCHRRGCSHGCVLDANHNANCVCPETHRLQLTNHSNCELDLPAAMMIMPSGHNAVPTGTTVHISPAGGSGSAPSPSAAVVSVTNSDAALGGPGLLIGSEAPHNTIHHSGADVSNERSTPTASALYEQEVRRRNGNSMAWVIIVLLLLSITGLVTLVSLLILYRQGRLPRQVSQLSVSFIQRQDKDGAILLLDEEP